jgi:hypothetical protein
MRPTRPADLAGQRGHVIHAGAEAVLARDVRACTQGLPTTRARTCADGVPPGGAGDQGVLEPRFRGGVRAGAGVRRRLSAGRLWVGLATEPRMPDPPHHRLSPHRARKRYGGRSPR